MLSPASRCQHRWRGSSDPFGLARQLEGGERRRHSIRGNSVDDVANLEESIKRRNGCQHRKGADPEKGEQQPAAYAEAFKLATEAGVEALAYCCRLTPEEIAIDKAVRIVR